MLALKLIHVNKWTPWANMVHMDLSHFQIIETRLKIGAIMKNNL